MPASSDEQMRTDPQPIRLALIAPRGKMGMAIQEAVADDADFVLDQDHADVLVDFSSPDALEISLDRAVRAAAPILVGTTGLGASALAKMEWAARSVAVLHAANTSLGVALLSELVERAAKVLGRNWDVELVEAHHRHKADAPSGTALVLAEAAARGRGVQLEAELDRHGTGLSRNEGVIGFAVVRGGTVAGDHDVLFLGPDERLILSHRAENRMIFARGALAAARFLHGKRPGLYNMRDVIANA